MRTTCIYVTGLLTAILLLTQCTTSKNVEKEQQEKVEKEIYPSTVIPEWFDRQDKSGHDSLSFYSYASAIARDSLSSVEKTKMYAVSNLEKGVASLLEEKRKQLTKKEKSGSRYETASFLIALRNSHSNLESLVSFESMETVEVGNAYRSFIRIELAKEKLYEYLDKSLSDYREFVQYVEETE